MLKRYDNNRKGLRKSGRIASNDNNDTKEEKRIW